MYGIYLTNKSEYHVDGDELNLMPIFEMGEVEKFGLLRPEHRFISNQDIAIDADDVTLSNQQFIALNSWVNNT